MAPFRVLIFTKATDYYHDCIPDAAKCLQKIIDELGGQGVISSSASPHFDSINNLLEFKAIAFISNSGELFNEDQKQVFERYVREHKRGVIGSHAATAAFLSGEDASGATVMSTTYPFYANMWGASFTDHPPIQDGTVLVDTEACAKYGITLPKQYTTNDEWYNFDRDVTLNTNITVLAKGDVTTFEGSKMGSTHPLVWAHDFEGARVFYTALGHHPEMYEQDKTIVGPLRAGTAWCLNL